MAQDRREMRTRKALFCERVLREEMGKGNVPLFALKKFLCRFKDVPGTKSVAARAAHRLSGLGKHRLSALLHLDAGDPASAGEELNSAGMFYPAVHVFQDAGQAGDALDAADKLITYGGQYSSERELFEEMDLRVGLAKALLLQGTYLDAARSFLSLMMVEKALECAEALEKEKSYLQAVKVYLPLGMLHKAVECFIKMMGEVQLDDPGLSPEVKELSIEGWCCHQLADKCGKQEMDLERNEFQCRATDLRTLIEESLEENEATPNVLKVLDKQLMAGLAFFRAGNVDAALESGENLGDAGLHLSAARLYGKMGEQGLKAPNLVLAGEFEEAYWTDVSRNAKAQEITN